MDDSENLAALRARRNLIKMGSVGAASAAVLLFSLKAKPAKAGATSISSACATAIGCRCFLKGTRIRTVEGNRKIEDLKVGDLLPTMFGGVRPIEWIDRYALKKSDSSKNWVKEQLPVRIARSALGPGIPSADLYVTRAHELLIDGVLVPAVALINGTTISLDQARDREELEFFHIKLERHDVIYAEDAACETLLDVDERAVNPADHRRRHGAPPRDEARCAPSLGPISWGGRLELKSRLRSALSPWIDRRHELDILRDRLEEHRILVQRRAELMP